MYINDKTGYDRLCRMTRAELRGVCRELRETILRTVGKNGGHLSSNLGTVELTVALHSVFDVRSGDKIIFDTGHQSYSHKLLTGRASRFATLRKKGGISGFTRRSESEYDGFISGHSGNSISAAYGIAAAMKLKWEKGAVAAVIGDGAFTSGQAYEGLNNAGKSDANLTVVLNDNAMSISKSTGALAMYLSRIRSTKRYYRAKQRVKSALSSVPIVGERLERVVSHTKNIIKDALYDSGGLFESLGFAYIGPVNGHDIDDLIEAFSLAKMMERPCVVHVFTTKGKGFKRAEKNPGEYHAVCPAGKAKPATSFTEVFGKELARLGKADGRICAVTAAMKYATGLNFFKDECPRRFFDTGIAEQHSVTFAAGLAAEGMRPVFAVYSTFLQRGFDQIIHDCAIESCGGKVVFAIDRAGLVGEDGETHQGIFDVPMLRLIPGVTVYSPASYEELRQSLSRALYETKGTACVRYPKGSEYDFGGAELPPTVKEAIAPAKDYYWSGRHSRVLAVSYGRISVPLALACAETGTDLLRLVKINPLPESVFVAASGYDRVVFFEEGSLRGGVAEGLFAGLAGRGFKRSLKAFGIDGEFVPAATTEQQLEMYGLDLASMRGALKTS